MTETPITATAEDDEVFDLERQRTVRREASGAKPIRLRLNGNVHTLPAELPLDVFAPIEHIDLDVALLLRLAMDARDGRPDASRDATNVVIDMLVTNPALPREVLAAIRQMAKNLLTEAAYDDLIRSRPSREDIGDIAKHLFEKYGVNLPEASDSSGSVDAGGTTSKQTSNGSTDSTPDTSGPTPEPTPTTSAPAA